MDLEERKRRSLAWLNDLKESQKSWIDEVRIEPKQRMTAESVNEKYYMQPINEMTLYMIIDDIQKLIRDMYVTPDQIIAADAEALAMLVRIRTNCEVVIDDMRAKQRKR